MKVKLSPRPVLYPTLQNVETVQILTEPDEDGRFIEVQVADLGDGTLNVVIAGEVERASRLDKYGNTQIRVWPTSKGEKKMTELTSNERWLKQ